MSSMPESPLKSSKEHERNRKYLRLIFDHSDTVVEEVLKTKNGNYAYAYDSLVRKNGHGTPGTLRQSGEWVPGIPPLTRTRRSSGAAELYDLHKRRIDRAEELIESFEERESSLTDYWKKMWGEGYKGFRDAQKEVGVLRDDIVKGKFKEGISKYTLQYLRNKLNFMLRSSVSEWYKIWGELDLHRLSTRDALELVRNLLRQPPWGEMRIIAGQRPHTGDDHSSEGILYNLIHCIFGKEKTPTNQQYNSEQRSMICEIQRYAEENQIKTWFYSNDAAVYLQKPKKAKQSSSPMFARRRSTLAGHRFSDLPAL